MTFDTAETTMWSLVQLYTGHVGYQRGAKTEGLSANPPVIDCSGWTGLLLTKAMQAENDAAGCEVFGTAAPEDDAPFVSECFGGLVSPGISLTPLAEWLVLSQPRLFAGEVWAVDPFRLASKS